MGTARGSTAKMASAFLNRMASVVTFGGPLAYVFATDVMFTVDAGEGAVMQNQFDVPGICARGIDPTPLGEGLRFKFPFIQKPHIFETRTALFELPASSNRTADQQLVSIKLRLLCRPQFEYLPEILVTYGEQNRCKEVALTGRQKQVLPSVVARYNAEDLIVRREEVSQAVSDELKRECEQHCHVVVEDVAIVDCQFSDEWQASVEAKVVAQQAAEREKFVVMQTERMRRLKVVYSSAQSEAGKIINDAMKANG